MRSRGMPALSYNVLRGSLIVCTQLLANITCNKHATTSLLLGSALVSWVELQLRSVRPSEALAWVKILENIVTAVDFARVEKATDGHWRTTITRCLIRIISHPCKLSRMRC